MELQQINGDNFKLVIGAGDGNRTHTASLGSWSTTTMQHPHYHLLQKYICHHLRRYVPSDILNCFSNIQSRVVEMSYLFKLVVPGDNIFFAQLF